MSCRFFTTDLSGGFKLSAGRISMFFSQYLNMKKKKTTNNKIIEDHKKLLLNFFLRFDRLSGQNVDHFTIYFYSLFCLTALDDLQIFTYCVK